METSERIWSDQQGGIFSWTASGSGNLVARARAGTGKTTTICHAASLAPKGHKVVVCAFNKKIQLELERRVKGNVEAKTLHAIGFGLLRQIWAGIHANESDAVDRDRARDACGHQAPDEIVLSVKKLASLLKNVAPLTYDIEVVKDVAQRFDIEPTEENEREGWDLERLCRSAGKARDAALDRDAQGRISFDDMVFCAVALDLARPRYDLVIVDEAQDMNAAQLLLARAIVKKTGRIMIVGDDRQAIYGFRGADADGIDRLKAELSAQELGLTTTYRCAQAIVRVAQAVVPDFVAGPNNPEGVVDSLGYDAVFGAAKPGDFVLSRKNAPLMPLCLGFLKRGIRARIEGRDLGKMLANIVAGFKAKSVPNYLDKVNAWTEKMTKRVNKIAKEDLRTAKLDEVRDQAEVLTAIAEGCANVAEILTRCTTLFGDSDGTTPAHVILSSVHKAKGLEADRVFILADTVSTRSVEESNIYYVAVTRAKNHLTWLVRGVA